MGWKRILSQKRPAAGGEARGGLFNTEGVGIYWKGIEI